MNGQSFKLSRCENMKIILCLVKYKSQSKSLNHLQSWRFRFQSDQTQKYFLLTRKDVDTKVENDFNKNTLSNSAPSSTNKHMRED